MHPTGFGAAGAGGFLTKGLKANRFKEKTAFNVCGHPCVLQWKEGTFVLHLSLCQSSRVLPLLTGASNWGCGCEKHVDIFEHWFASKKKDKALSVRHIPRHSRWSFHRWPQGFLNATTFEIGLLWLDAIANNLKCMCPFVHGSIKASHLVAGSLPLPAAFASPISSAASAPAFGLTFQRKTAPLELAFCCNKCSLGTHQELPLPTASTRLVKPAWVGEKMSDPKPHWLHAVCWQFWQGAHWNWQLQLLVGQQAHPSCGGCRGSGHCATSTSLAFWQHYTGTTCDNLVGSSDPRESSSDPMGLLMCQSKVVLVRGGQQWSYGEKHVAYKPSGSRAFRFWYSSMSSLCFFCFLSVQHGRFDPTSEHSNSDPRSKSWQQWS